MMKLYTGPLSMFGAKAQIAIGEKSLPCEIELVPFNLKTRYEPRHPEVVRINPKGQIPVLIDGEVQIFDSTQIFEYLEHRYPAVALWPATPPIRAQARLLELQSDEVFFPIVKQLMDLRSGGDSAAMAATRPQVNAFYDKMEGILQHSRFLAGEYSYVDIAFIMAHYFAAYLGSDLGSEHDNLRQWRTHVTQRPAVHNVLGPMGSYLSSVGLVPPAFAYP